MQKKDGNAGKAPGAVENASLNTLPIRAVDKRGKWHSSFFLDGYSSAMSL
jgi:hypothetical protein